jgi:putative chitinase
MLTTANLMAGCGASSAVAGTWLAPIQAACDAYQINTPLRQAAFLATLGVESAYLLDTSENLNYSAQGLANCWPHLFAAPGNEPNALALSIADNPQAIANNVYANLNGNGDVASGDGYTYRGRGLIQITGRNNYAACAAGMVLDVVNNPDLLLTPENAALSAGWYWASRNLNPYADAREITMLSKIINCGNPNSDITPNGMPERLSLYNAACKSFGV